MQICIFTGPQQGANCDTIVADRGYLQTVNTIDLEHLDLIAAVALPRLARAEKP